MRVRKDGLAAPTRLMKSREELESERIWRAPMRVPVVWGVNETVRSQEAAGTRVAQVLLTVKSGSIWRERMWRVAVPVLERVMIWGVRRCRRGLRGR